MEFSIELEKYWRNKMSKALNELGAVKSVEFIRKHDKFTNDVSVDFTLALFDQMREELSEEQIIRAVIACACEYPTEELQELREDYLIHQDLERVHSKLYQNFLVFLKNLNLPEDIEKKIIELKWGVAGELHGTTIIATKIPKSGYIREYFEAEDSETKRRIYCHCPRIRDVIGEDKRLYSLYCYCGAGFFKGLWEYILGRSIQIRVKDSILDGGNHCSFELDLK